MPISKDLSTWTTLLHAGWAEQVVMGCLLLFSVISWAIIVFKWAVLRRASRQSSHFIRIFWDTKRFEEIFQKSEVLQGSPVSTVFRAGYIELSKLKKLAANEEIGSETHLGVMESVERSMRRAASSQTTGLESMVSFLGTTGSTAPFIGLLGTVVGIMGSFQDIGRMGNASLVTVAPGIGGALIATAAGLFAAIPAVMAYNYFLSRIRVLETEMQNFSADFLNIIKRKYIAN